jgi:hypothetical protein
MINAPAAPYTVDEPGSKKPVSINESGPDPGFLHLAWPVAVTEHHGALHRLTVDGYVIEGRDYTGSAEVATRLLADHPQADRSDNTPRQPYPSGSPPRTAAGLPDETVASFLRRYDRPDGTQPVIEVGDSVERWPTIVVRFGEKTAVIQFCGVGAGTDDAHLSVDIHAFVADRLARASAFGMENGRRYPAFGDTAPGTSHGWPAVQGVTVMIGRQTSRADHA